MDITQKVAALLAEHALSTQAGPMLCGLSGGADSVAMVLVLRELGYDVRALHCNFQLRGDESERDESFVRQFCSRHSIPLLCTRFDTRSEAASRGESIEMAARRLRYAWFEQQAAALRASGLLPQGAEPHICVAHHADDNVETMLLNLVRGAGLHGLTGMSVVNDKGIVRPLLCLTREDVTTFLAARGEAYVIDSTNADVQYRRNLVRHQLLPLLRTMNPSIDRTLTETMSRLREAEQALLGEEADASAYRQKLQLLELGFTPAQIDQMNAAQDGAFTTAGRMMLTKHRGKLIWGEMPATVAPTPIAARRAARSEVTDLRNPRVGVFDARAVKGPLYVRSIGDGDRFRPFGMRGTKLVSDYLTDRRRSRLDKLAALVVCDDEGILWLVGETIDQRAAVTATTQEVIIVEHP